MYTADPVCDCGWLYVPMSVALKRLSMTGCVGGGVGVFCACVKLYADKVHRVLYTT